MASEAELGKGTQLAVSDIISRIERLPYSAWHVWIVGVVGITLFFDALDNISIAYVLPVVNPLWHLTLQQVGSLISATYIGGMVGALVCGWLADRYGRMRLIMFTVALYAVMSLLAACSWNFSSLFVCRTIQGFGLGAEMPIAPTFINEWCKTRGRGRFFLLFSTLYVVGALAGALLGMWIVPTFGWRYMFCLGAVPAIFIIILRWFVPESPRWLASKGRLEEANRIVSRAENSISKGGKIPLPPIVPIAVSGPGKKTRFSELFQSIYLRRTLVLWTLWFCICFVNLAITAWMPTIYRTVFKLPLRTALTYGMLASLTVVISTVISAFLIDWAGRRTWFAVCLLAGCIPWFIVAYVQPATPEVFLICMYTGILFIASNMNVMLLYMTEIYPTRMRALGSSVSRVWYGIAAILSPVVIGFIVQRFGLWPVPLVMACVALTAGIVAALFAVETKGRVLEDIAP